MLDDVLYKEELEVLREYARKKQYVPLSKIIEVFHDPSEELLDDIVEYLENENIEITRDSDDVPTEEELLIEETDDDFEAFLDISRSGEIVDLGAELGIIKKSGSWYSYNDTKLAQGRDACKQVIQDNPELAEELEGLIFKAMSEKE